MAPGSVFLLVTEVGGQVGHNDMTETLWFVYSLKREVWEKMYFTWDQLFTLANEKGCDTFPGGDSISCSLFISSFLTKHISYNTYMVKKQRIYI